MEHGAWSIGKNIADCGFLIEASNTMKGRSEHENGLSAW